MKMNLKDNLAQSRFSFPVTILKTEEADALRQPTADRLLLWGKDSFYMLPKSID